MTFCSGRNQCAGFSGGRRRSRAETGFGMRKLVFAGVISALWLVAGAGVAGAAPLTAQQALGKKLFFDKSLSHGGNQSCASCHAPGAGFTDPNKANSTSAGSNRALFGARNTPTAMYAAYSPAFGFDPVEGLYVGGQFLDGRASTLEDQAMAPFLNPIEMGNLDKVEVIARLSASATAADFQAVFGVDALSDVDTAFGNIAVAIADYERSSELSPFTSKFDYVLRGQVRLNAGEARGLSLFNDPNKGNCAACHISDVAEDGTHPLFTDFTYDNIGIPKNYDSQFLTMPPQFNPDGAAFQDRGLGGFVDDPSLDGAFKVSTLRNLDLTGPYGHNGYFNSLDQIIDFYSSRDVKPACADPTLSAAEASLQGCWPVAEFASTMNVDELGDLGLTAQERADIALFLGTLTDGYDPSSFVPEPAAWALMILGFGLAGAGLRSGRRRSTAS